MPAPYEGLTDTDMRDDDLTFMARFIPTTLTALDISRTYTDSAHSYIVNHFDIGNKITSVPSSLRLFRKLKSLDLSRNEQLRFVTSHLAQLFATEIDLRECPALLAPSPSVTQGGPKAVRSYFGQPANFWLPHRVTVAVLGAEILDQNLPYLDSDVQSRTQRGGKDFARERTVPLLRRLLRDARS